MNDTGTLSIIHRGDLPRGGFAGVRETRMVMAFEPGAARLGSFVYLADAVLIPRGSTRMHPHQDVDIVTVMLKGRIEHRGSVGDGTILNTGTVQVQRSGTGITHNEINPDEEENRLLQIWFLPPKAGLDPDYQTFEMSAGNFTTIIGGDGTFDNASKLEIGKIRGGDSVTTDRHFIAYIAEGEGEANGVPVAEGDLIEGDEMTFRATDGAILMVVTESTTV
jgi:redox-sensitive bicupin YhaK (pirin superfamily)